MKKLIPVINKLQDIFQTVGIRDRRIDLPQIVVIGEQSTGKSSVLENVVGYDFLPRGNNVVTRRPLVLQLVHTPNKPMKAELLDAYLDKKKIKYKKRFTSYNDIQKTIAEVTEKAAANKSIIDQEIRLKIFSSEVIELTLVDLPGITKVPVGNQDPQIEKITTNMALKYIRSPNSIILAVAAANSDIANSVALKLAKSVDQAGERTIGVLTKVDIMDEGTDAMHIFTGKTLPLKRGYIGVINRSQRDIKNKKTIKDALKSEHNYFGSHKAYRSVANRMGIPYLSKKLNKILLDKIRSVLPDLKIKIDNLITHAKSALDKYGPSVAEDGELRSALLSYITRFAHDYRDCIEGRNFDSKKELFGGARINYIFYKRFIPSLNALEPTRNLTDHDIKIRIEIAKGTKTTLGIPEHAFEILVKNQVERLEMPSLRCCDLVENELKTIIDHCLKSLTRFPILKERIKEYSIKLLKHYMNPLKKHIKDTILCELAYINTNHPDFFGGGTKLLFMEKLKKQKSDVQPPEIPKSKLFSTQSNPLGSKDKRSKKSKKDDLYSYNPPSKPPPPQKLDREKMEVQVIRTLLGKYFEIVRKQISDSVPKAVMFFMVEMSSKNIHAELIKKVYTKLNAENLLKESEEVKQKRKATKKMLNILCQAKEILNEVKDINI